MGCNDDGCLTELLARRFDLLDVLTEGSLTKSDLETRLDISRSTIDRAVRSLEANDIVVRDAGTVALTEYGRVALEGYREFQLGLEGLREAGSILSTFDSDESIPFGFFRGAEVVDASRQSPHRPIVAFEQYLEDVDSVRSVATGLVPDYVEFYHREIVDHQLSGEVVVKASVLDNLLSTYWEPMSEILSTGRLNVYETTADVPYSIKVGQGSNAEVALITYGPQGVTGFMRSDTREAVEWARDLFERLKDDATLIAPMD
jgi:predicted transcriptional regulator